MILAVTDLNRAVEFYRDRLGLKLSSTNEDFAFFDAGGFMIALRGGRAKSDPADLTSVEIAFAVEHVKPAHQALRALGVEFKREPRIVTGSTWAIDFRDPETVGTFLYHCHILDHEDGGMMAKIQVLPAQN